MEIGDRFGKYAIGTTGDAFIRTNNGTFAIQSAEELVVESRFGAFELNTLTDLRLRANTNSEYRIESLTNLYGEGRFTKLWVGSLGGEAEVELYNGNFAVDRLAADFRGVEVSGSFYKVDLKLSGTPNYRVAADLQLGKLDVPGSLNVIERREEHRNLKYVGETAGAGSDAARIIVKGQQGELRVR